jgi:hypothetical protein
MTVKVFDFKETVPFSNGFAILFTAKAVNNASIRQQQSKKQLSFVFFTALPVKCC